ncbi:uncharacterized protein PV06_06899 [Exophiala oligosperma]|uniref:Enoyl reductase (ER) domain-containing protein n=1 Tax=Exophiala oligosperma TaxID=215243 RepID=A0A0D2AMY5_9EURO|nr:uncharacterized protein PV06_06899 [Exophiala oligosperma]KIW41331.1 hypothetical protein PV06_06899 [Exophiala oligosperma]
MSTHKAALLHSAGSPLVVEDRATPKPGPKDLLISVSAIALNPVDCYQRAMGLFLTTYPAILGSDIAGTIEAVGSSVPGPFKVGGRVLAFASAFYRRGEANANDYSSYQAKVLVQYEAACTIPDSLSFIDAATLPMGVGTAWSGWHIIGLNTTTHFNPADKKGVVVWGAASSVGVCAVQSAKAMGFTVYATASAKNFDYVKSIGAKEVFDYKDADVVSKLLAAAKKDDVKLNTIYRAAGDRGGSDVQPLLDIVSASGGGSIASAVGPLLENTPQAKGVDLKFVINPSDADARDKQYKATFQGWLAPRLLSGEFIPGPKARIVGKGLESLNKGLDELMGGVSLEKLVVEV